jgi:hypothetical protein
MTEFLNVAWYTFLYMAAVFLAVWLPMMVMIVTYNGAVLLYLAATKRAHDDKIYSLDVDIGRAKTSSKLYERYRGLRRTEVLSAEPPA